MGDTLDKSAQVLKYFAQQDPGILRKRLTKMSYMSDIIAREYTDAPITNFRWRVDQFGPYSPEIPETIKELESAGFVWTRDTFDAETGRAEKKLFDSGQRVVFEFSPVEEEVLAYVVQNYLHMDMQELLLDVVYRTKPFLENEGFHKPLNMDLVNGTARRRAGFDLAALINAERQGEAGDFLTARQYFDGLRGRIAARYPD